MKKYERLSVFSVGALGYGGLELLWRGRTHWTMLLAGGAAFSLIYAIENRELRPLYKLTLGALAITGVELCFGIAVNLILRWEVWDYSDCGPNLWGQICLPYCALWLLLCAPCLLLAGHIRGHMRAPPALEQDRRQA